MLRELRPDVRIGFFLHIPFPPRELFMQLPWRREILEGMLGADLVGFQVSGGASNFARLAPRRAVGATGSGGRVALRRTVDRAWVRSRSPSTCDDSSTARERSARSRRAPADPRRARRSGGRPARRRPPRLHQGHRPATPRGRRAVRGRDPRSVEARHGADRDPEPRGRPALPARTRDLERLIGEVNGQHATVGHAPIHYLYQSVSPDELVALVSRPPTSCS